VRRRARQPNTLPPSSDFDPDRAARASRKLLAQFIDQVSAFLCASLRLPRLGPGVGHLGVCLGQFAAAMLLRCLQCGHLCLERLQMPF